MPSLQGGIGSNSVNSVHHIKRAIALILSGQRKSIIVPTSLKVSITPGEDIRAAESVAFVVGSADEFSTSTSSPRHRLEIVRPSTV